jgi:hypothetical protein
MVMVTFHDVGSHAPFQLRIIIPTFLRFTSISFLLAYFSYFEKIE